MPEGGEDVVEGHVGDGFGGGACTVAVEDAWASVRVGWMEGAGGNACWRLVGEWRGMVGEE